MFLQRNNIFNLLYQFNQINVIQFQKYICYYVSKIKKINILKPPYNLCIIKISMPCLINVIKTYYYLIVHQV